MKWKEVYKKKHILQEKSNQGTEEKETKPRKASGLGEIVKKMNYKGVEVVPE